MKRTCLVLMSLLMLAFALTGCGNVTYKDGTYTGQSIVYEDEDNGEGNGYGVVTITIKDNVITDCEFQTYQEDGTLKDESYGRAMAEKGNADYYAKAQKAVAGAQDYADQLAEKGSLAEVDAVSGATINFSEFTDAVQDALNQAKE